MHELTKSLCWPSVEFMQFFTLDTSSKRRLFPFTSSVEFRETWEGLDDPYKDWGVKFGCPSQFTSRDQEMNNHDGFQSFLITAGEQGIVRERLVSKYGKKHLITCE